MIKSDMNFKIPEPKTTLSTFVNPMGTDKHPDPCIIYCQEEKCYYALSTPPASRILVLHRAQRFEDVFRNDESKIIYEVNEDDLTYGSMWAPELHFIKGKWYIYTSCENSPEDSTKHILVLEAKTDSPFDGFKLCGHVNRDIYAIDPTVYVDSENDRLYLCCSPVIDGVQMLALQELKSPAEPIGEFALIAKPELDWELIPPYVGRSAIVEGGYFVKSPNGRLFILYSANGCWSDDYMIGLLEYKGGNLADASSWEKYPYPIFKKGNGNFGTGHATFFYSPDKTELWICFHCLKASNPSVQPTERLCHCQRVYFDEFGFVHVGAPVPNGEPYPVPSSDF